MQSVAAEMNLSETAFLYEEGDGYNLHWFMPEVEVDLCGHATLASAHILYETGALSDDQAVRFHTASGLLTVRRNDDGTLTMDFPATTPEEAEPPPELGDVFGIELVWTGRSPFDIFVEAASEATIRSLDPDPAAVAALGARGVIVTARADPGSGPGQAGKPYDFVSRFFSPSLSGLEDPVTGSAHCALAPYWTAKFGRDALMGFQASARGGFVGVRVVGDRVELTGRAVTVFRGELDA
jgi:PhzF family phenazine biosynthesis protein